MPRKARQKSKTGIYHIMLRGANRQEIFHDDTDNRRFLNIFGKYAKGSGTNVYGWCLMGNHVHLLLAEGSEELSVTMKRIGVSYVSYYNWKYETTGHLFQDRFKSENVESDNYLLTVIRYIHQNPIKAGMVKQAEDWEWSSCNGYYGGYCYQKELLDSSFILAMFSADKQLSISKFKEYNECENNDKCLDNDSSRITDEEARQKIFKLINGIELAQVKSLPKAERDKVFRRVKEIDAITQRQAARIFGVSPNLIFKA